MRGLLAAVFVAVLLVTLLPSPTAVARGPKHISGPELMQPNPDVYAQAPFVLDNPQTIDVQPARSQEKLLILLVRFSDVGNTTTPGAINSIIFGTSGSLATYYRENSYGKTSVTGLVSTSFLTVSNPMAGYGADSSTGIDDFNGPIYRLVTDAVKVADAQGFNFKQFDTDGDGVVDHLMVVHAGQGQETSSGNTNLIWSHRWAVLDADPLRPGDQPLLTTDGTRIYSYFMASEYSPVGVFAHEFGHDFGLPDLYDTDGSSKGAGVWDIMSSGSWLGSPRGTNPAHFSAWSKIKLGWIQPTVVTLPLAQESILQVETTARAYKLPIRSSTQGDEYFLLENRERVGYDANLPGAGLLIWHVDDAMQDNDNDQHRLVTLMEADQSLWGDSPDRSTNPWANNDPGFTPTSIPNSNGYGNVPTNWMVHRISAVGTAMRADIAKEVAYDISVAEVARSAFISLPATENLRAIIVNKGALNVTQVQVNLTIYQGRYDPANVVNRNSTTIAFLGSGKSVNVTWTYRPATKGKYIVEVTADLAKDEVPQDNFRIVHFTVVTFRMRDDVEAGTNGWIASSGLLSQYQWQILSSSDPKGFAYSPTHAWRFGYVLNSSIANAPYYSLTSRSINIAGQTPRLTFFHRFDLTGKVQNGVNVPLQPINTDTARAEVSFDNGSWVSVGKFSGTQLAWGLFYADLTPVMPPGARAVRIRFNSTAGVMPAEGGWWIDDIALLDDALLPGLAVRPIEAFNTVPPGGRSLYHFTLVNVGDVLQPTAFQVQLPSGWRATLGTNDTLLINAADFSAYAAVDTPMVLVLGVEAPFLVERGSKVQGTLTATAVNTTSSSSFTFVAEVSSGFTLSFNDRTLLLGIMVATILVVITIVVEEVKKRHRRRAPLQSANFSRRP